MATYSQVMMFQAIDSAEYALMKTYIKSVSNNDGTVDGRSVLWDDINLTLKLSISGNKVNWNL